MRNGTVLVAAIIERQAEAAIGASTARGQGVAGVVKALRIALAKVPLHRFSVSNPAAFRKQLDLSTSVVKRQLPAKAQSWGLARKCLNIYLRDCFYNFYLRKHFNLSIAEPFFEIPLDSLTAKGLKAENERGSLPVWPGVKHLDKIVSQQYQNAAARLAAAWGIETVHLDTFLWVSGRKTPNKSFQRTARKRASAELSRWAAQ